MSPSRKRPRANWLHPGHLHPALGHLDERLAHWMHRIGHPAHRWGLGLFFLWLGLLKLMGHDSATSLLAKTTYLLPSRIAVVALGAWEAVIGVCLCMRPLIRLAFTLLALRLPGTVVALVVHAEECFTIVPWVPSLTGQYLLKDLVLFTAALVIGATVQEEAHPRRNPAPAQPWDAPSP
jgi:hypothetical protein